MYWDKRRLKINPSVFKCTHEDVSILTGWCNVCEDTNQLFEKREREHCLVSSNEQQNNVY